jgi:hypothetical protein
MTMELLTRSLRRLLWPGRAAEHAPLAHRGSGDARQVLLIVYDPVVPEKGGRRLREILGWGDPGDLTERFLQDLRAASDGLCDYRIARRLDVDGFPPKVDGFVYRPGEFLSLWQVGGGFHRPDWADYEGILAEHGVVPLVNDGQIDELWLFGPPYAGFYESRMVGRGAFWCNGPPIDGPGGGSRRFVVMGFNYERGVGEMLEAYGHRAESILERLFEGRRGGDNLWRLYCRHEKSNPGQSEVGTIHFAPNSERDYDWGNPRPVLSRCDNWYHFPDLSGPARLVDRREWGGGDIRLHHLWWFRHLPRAGGGAGGIEHNWWGYVVDPNRVR